MNQILVTKDKKDAQVTLMQPILKFFCVVIIIFALIFIGEGAYNIYSKISKGNSYPKPYFNYQKNGSDMELKISCEVGISKVLYSWNNGEKMEYKGEGRKILAFEIAVPQGENVLNVIVEDIEGHKTKFEGVNVSFTSSDDTIKPRISIEENDGKLVITATDDTELEYLIYQWEGKDEVKVNVSGDNKKEIKQEIEFENGNKKLTMIAADKAGNKANVEKNISSTGDTLKPKITISNDVAKLIITATDETELAYLTYQWDNGEEIKTVATEETKKTIKQEINVEKGTRTLTLTAIDKSGNKETVSKKIVGSNGPTIKVTLSDGNFVVKVTDEYKITKIKYTLNDEEHTVENIPENSKEYEFKVQLKPGVTNYLKINAFENDLMTEYKCKKTN